MCKFFIALLLSVFSLAGYAQTKEVDSLLKKLDIEKQDSNRVKLLRSIAVIYLDYNPSKTIEYLDKAMPLAKALQRKADIGRIYYNYGSAYMIKSDYDKSLENYLQSVRIFEEEKDNLRLSNAYMAIGTVYNYNKNDKKTDEYYLKAKAVIESMNDSLQLANLFGQWGIFFDQRKTYDSAMYYQQKALEIATKLNDPYLKVGMLGNIGLTFKHQGKPALALQYFDSVLSIIKQQPDVADAGAVYNNIAATLAQAGNYQKAKEAFDISINYARQTESRAVIMENYRNLADMYGNMKDYKNQVFYLQQYYTLKDSVFNSDTKNQLTQLEADYHLEQKNGEIVKQEAEVQKQKSQRNIFIILAAAGALLLITLGLFYSRIKNKNRLLEEQNIQINKQKDELQTLNHVKDRLFSIISHDLRNPLVTLRSYLTLTDNVNISEEKKQQFKTQTVQAVAQTSDMLDNLLAWANLQIKNTKANITPVSVQDAVQDAINVVQAQAEQKNIVIKKELVEAVVLADEHILAIALRNLLTNAVKYSGDGSTIHISSQKQDSNITLSVKDEGVGMTPEQVKQLQQSESESTKGTKGEKGSGLGIFLVMELLEKTNGFLTIKSEKDKGSDFIINLPALQ